MGHRDLLVTRTYLRQTPNARVCPREASAGRLSSSRLIGNLADLGAVLLRLDDGPLRKQARTATGNYRYCRIAPRFPLAGRPSQLSSVPRNRPLTTGGYLSLSQT